MWGSTTDRGLLSRGVQSSSLSAIIICLGSGGVVLQVRHDAITSVHKSICSPRRVGAELSGVSDSPGWGSGISSVRSITSTGTGGAAEVGSLE